MWDTAGKMVCETNSHTLEAIFRLIHPYVGRLLGDGWFFFIETPSPLPTKATDPISEDM